MIDNYTEEFILIYYRRSYRNKGAICGSQFTAVNPNGQEKGKA
jgi:hypothetical protein